MMKMESLSYDLKKKGVYYSSSTMSVLYYVSSSGFWLYS